MNRSPNWIFRESVETRLIRTSGAPVSNSPPHPAASSWSESESKTSILSPLRPGTPAEAPGRLASLAAFAKPERFERFLRMHAVVERHHRVLELLIRFVPLPGDDNGVAFSC